MSKRNNILIEDDSRSNFHLVLLPVSQSSEYANESVNSDVINSRRNLNQFNNADNDSSYTYLYESIDSESMKKLQKQNYFNRGMLIPEYQKKSTKQPISNDSEFTYVYETLSDENQSAYTYIYSYDEDSSGLRTNEYSYTYEDPLEDQINLFKNQQNRKLDKVIKTRNALFNNSPNLMNNDQSPSLSISKQAPIFIQRSPKTVTKNNNQPRKAATQNKHNNNNYEKPKKLSQRKKIVLRKINLLEEQLKDLESLTIASDFYSTETTESETKEDPKIRDLQKKLSHITGKKVRNANDSYSAGNSEYTYTYIYDEEPTEEENQIHNQKPHRQTELNSRSKPRGVNQYANSAYINQSPKTPHLVLQTMNNETVSIVNKNIILPPKTEEQKTKNKVDLQISSSIQSEKVLKSNNQPNEIDQKQAQSSSLTLESNHYNKNENANNEEIKDRSAKLENEKHKKTIKKIYRKIRVEKPKKSNKDHIVEPSIAANSPKKIRNNINIQSNENKEDSAELNDSEFAELNPVDAKKYTETRSIQGLNKLPKSRENDKKNTQNKSKYESFNFESNDKVKIKIVDELNIPDVDRFCVFYIEGDNESVKRTHTINKGQKFSDETFEFSINESLPSKLVIFLKKQDLIKEDKIMGTTKIDLKKLPPNETLSKLIPLKSDSGVKTESKIHLVLKRTAKTSEINDPLDLVKQREVANDTNLENTESQKSASHHRKNHQKSRKQEPSGNKRKSRHHNHLVDDNKLLDENSESEDENIDKVKTNKSGAKEIEIDVDFLPESSSSEYSSKVIKRDIPINSKNEEEEELSELCEEESLSEDNQLSESKDEEPQQSQEEYNEEEEEYNDEEESVSQKELSESKDEEESSEISDVPRSLSGSPSINESSENNTINKTRSYSSESGFNHELNSASFLPTNEKAVKLENNLHSSSYFNSNINVSLSEQNEPSTVISNELISNQSSLISNSGSFFQITEKAVKLANNPHDSSYFNSSNNSSLSDHSEPKPKRSNELVSNQSSAASNSIVSNSGSFLRINEKAVKLENDPHGSDFFNTSNFSSSQFNEDESTIVLSYGSSINNSIYNSLSDDPLFNERNVLNIESDPNSNHSSLAKLSSPSPLNSNHNQNLSSSHSVINENQSEGSDISNTPALPSTSSLPSVQESSNSINSEASNLSSISSYSISISDGLLNQVGASSSSSEFSEKDVKPNKKDVKRKSVKIAFSNKRKSVKSTDEDYIINIDDNSHSFSSNISNDLGDVQLFSNEDKSHNFTSSENESDSNFKFQSGHRKSSSQKSSDSYRKNSNQKLKESHRKSSSKSANAKNSLEFNDDAQSSENLSNSSYNNQISTKNKKKKVDATFSDSDNSLDYVKTLSSPIDSDNLSGPLHEKYLQNYAKLQYLNSSPRNLLDPQDFSSSPKSSPSQDNYLSDGPSDSLDLTASERSKITNSKNSKNSSKYSKSYRNSKSKPSRSSTYSQNMMTKSQQSTLKSTSSKPVIYDKDE